MSNILLTTDETLYQLRSDTRPACTAHKMHLAQDRTILTVQVRNSLQRGMLISKMADILLKRLEQKSLVKIGNSETARFVHNKENAGTRVLIMEST